MLGMISNPYIKKFTEEERSQLEKTPQFYKPGYPIFTSDRERLIDGLPS